MNQPSINPIPRIVDTHSLANSKYFTTLELRSGYWHWSWVSVFRPKQHSMRVSWLIWMQMGAFWIVQRTCYLPELYGKMYREFWTSLTDIIIISSTFEEYVECLQVVFLRISRRTVSNWSQVSVNSIRRKIIPGSHGICWTHSHGLHKEGDSYELADS